jgi:GTPase SAR1 family protein
MGADAVGKTALTNQFMSSEFLSSNDFENGKPNVTIFRYLKYVSYKLV